MASKADKKLYVAVNDVLFPDRLVRAGETVLLRPRAAKYLRLNGDLKPADASHENKSDAGKALAKGAKGTKEKA